MAEALTSEQFAAEYTKDINFGPGAEPKPDSQSPSFKEFSKARAEGKITGHEESEPEAKPESAPRDDKGRFSKVKESLRQAEIKGTYRRAVVEGHIQPSEEMDADTWNRARWAELTAKASGITVPEELLKEQTNNERNGAEAAQKTNGEQALSAEETQHFQKYETYMSDLAAKSVIDPDTKKALDGFNAAAKAGVPQEAIDLLGHVISDADAPHEVLLALGKDPTMIQVFSRMSPAAMGMAVQALSKQLGALKTANQPPPKPPKPKPPEIVGARAASVAFDVNDDATDSETWVKERWKQVHGGRRDR